MKSDQFHQTLAALCCGETLGADQARNFAHHTRWLHDDRESLTRIIADLRRELALRDSEIAMLKTELMERETHVPDATSA